MENHIRKISQRQLPLYGKSISIKILILARRTFLRKVFLIPAKIIQKIHKNIFQYLWQIKIPEPITRKTLFLPKSKGGLNIKESEARNLSIHIKHWLTLKDKENQPPWMSIGIYWLEEDMITITKNSTTWKTTTSQKQIKWPLYYWDQIYYIKSNIPNLQNKTKIK